jgi:hypothetical protein
MSTRRRAIGCERSSAGRWRPHTRRQPITTTLPVSSSSVTKVTPLGGLRLLAHRDDAASPGARTVLRLRELFGALAAAPPELGVASGATAGRSVRPLRMLNGTVQRPP